MSIEEYQIDMIYKKSEKEQYAGKVEIAIRKDHLPLVEDMIKKQFICQVSKLDMSTLSEDQITWLSQEVKKVNMVKTGFFDEIISNDKVKDSEIESKDYKGIYSSKKRGEVVSYEKWKRDNRRSL